MSAFLIVLAAGVACYVIRYASLVVLTRWPLPARAERSLRYVAPASVGALLATTMRADLPALDGPDAFARIVAIFVAAVVVARTQRAFLGVVIGLPVVWLITAIS
jgi:branched-subunit amino acid transport protein